ncbi:unnamed protein product [Closterium sp. NIES-53]
MSPRQRVPRRGLRWVATNLAPPAVSLFDPNGLSPVMHPRSRGVPGVLAPSHPNPSTLSPSTLSLTLHPLSHSNLSHPPPSATLRPLSHSTCFISSLSPCLLTCLFSSLSSPLSPPVRRLSADEEAEVQGGGGESEEGESDEGAGERGESESDSEEESEQEEGGGAGGVSSQWEELVSEEEREREEEKRRKKRRKKGRKSGSSDSDSSSSDESSEEGEEEEEEEEREEGEERGEEEGGKAGKRKRKGQGEGDAFKDMDFGEGGEMVVRVVGQGGVGGGVLRCRVCPRVLCVNSDNMKKHLASKKHVAAVGRHERGELQVVVNSDGEVEAIGETHAERFERTKAAAAAAAADAAAAAAEAAEAAAAATAAGTAAADGAAAGSAKKHKADGGRQRQQRRKQLQQQKKKKLGAEAATAGGHGRDSGMAGAAGVPGTPKEAARSRKTKKGGADKASGGNVNAGGAAVAVAREGGGADGSGVGGVGGVGDKHKKRKNVKELVKGGGVAGSAPLAGKRKEPRRFTIRLSKEKKRGLANRIKRGPMFIQHVAALSKRRIVLASASPRRRELLSGLGLSVDVIPSTFNEDLNKAAFASAGDYAAETATHKAIEVSSKALRAAQASGEAPPTLVIAADTVVEIDGELLEKPASKEDAIRMLSLLSGRKHRVFTGVALVLPAVTDPLIGRSPLLRSFHECTQVEFASLSRAEIEAYVATGEPMDKAGGYGIQGLGGCLVKAINGCYFNVMGLPLNR